MIESGRVRLPVADVEKALRFYIERLGVKLVGEGQARVDMGEGFEIELVQSAQHGPTWLTLLVRGDFEEAVATYENRSLVLTRGTADGAEFAECTDLDGHVLRFVSAPPLA